MDASYGQPEVQVSIECYGYYGHEKCLKIREKILHDLRPRMLDEGKTLVRVVVGNIGQLQHTTVKTDAPIGEASDPMPKPTHLATTRTMAKTAQPALTAQGSGADKQKGTQQSPTRCDKKNMEPKSANLECGSCCRILDGDCLYRPCFWTVCCNKCRTLSGHLNMECHQSPVCKHFLAEWEKPEQQRDLTFINGACEACIVKKLLYMKDQYLKEKDALKGDKEKREKAPCQKPAVKKDALKGDKEEREKAPCQKPAVEKDALKGDKEKREKAPSQKPAVEKESKAVAEEEPQDKHDTDTSV
ncbi:unnamed protein product, partial [Mesorhabditis spiculigera]